MESPFIKTNEIHKLPELPGVYKYYDSEKSLIYVGKAKNLKKRVSSYFNKSATLNRKTIKMVSEIKEIEFTIANSEFDALLLENNLIKSHQPKYNILLKDDKTYPYLCVTNERFPRVIATRKLIPGSGKYYGPFASVKAMNNVLELVRNLFTIRTCKYNLSKENIKKEKFKVCLEYHIGNCKGPCENLQTEQDYNLDLEQVKNIFKGHLSPAKQFFRDEMVSAAERLEFEQAQKYKEKLDLLEKFQSKSTIVNPEIRDTDVFSIVSDEKFSFVNYLKVINGSIVLTKTIEIKKKLEESDEDILTLMIIDLRQRFESNTKEVISNIELPALEESLIIQVPKIGDKKKLLELSIKNSLYHKKEKLSLIEGSKNNKDRVLEKLQKDLQLKTLPQHIECFDNSNIQGSNPVASMVCFKDGRPSKKDYRHYNIKTVEGPNDFASMYEITNRRYKRLMEEEKEFPDLIVIDGGKGQLGAAVQSLKDLGIYGKIPVIGIAKRLEEIYFPEDPFPIHLDKKGESLILLQKIRDEAHRFAINFHRDKRSKSSIKSELVEIKGIGKNTMEKLYQEMGSLKKIKNSSIEELEQIVGKSKAKIVNDYFLTKKK
jgi:excinuclease ABC subunit C